MGKFSDKRKDSWDSKVSNGTIDGYAKYKLSPSSILSTNSDITFTTKKLNTQLRCGCYIIASLLCFLLFCAISIYTGYTFFLSKQESEQVFRVQFRVTDGDRFTSDLTNSSSNSFRIHVRDYKERLNLLFRRSSIKYGFKETEILALDGNSNNELIVHFNVKLDTRYLAVEALDIRDIIRNEILLQTDSLYFNNLAIDANSLSVTEYCDIAQQDQQSSSSSQIHTEIANTNTTYIPRSCSPIKLNVCNSMLSYNYTSYPNFLGHNAYEEMIDDIITFRELIDSECYQSANDFLCKLLQPKCVKDVHRGGTKILPVCRNYCRDFIHGCGNRLTAKVKQFFDCNRFPEFIDDHNCLSNTNCVKDLDPNQLCDGIIDCHDLSDERHCSYCSKNEIHCGFGTTCIPKNRRCDGKVDCPNASDEKLCVTLEENLSEMEVKQDTHLTPYSLKYNSNGVVVLNEKSQLGKLCVDNLPANSIKQVAISLCQSLTFKGYSEAVEVKDNSLKGEYVQVSNITKAEIKFEKTHCEHKKILQVQCSNLTCGLLPINFDSHDHSKIYWPWHVILYKDQSHICDATLVSLNWILTTISCFQGQSKAEWIARFGTNRILSNPPWLSERAIVGMVKSPVEGSSIVLLKLEEPVNLSDFVRPICLPDKWVEMPSNFRNCYTLGWSEKGQQLQTVPIVFKNMDFCENFSIKTKNSVCTETDENFDDCSVEEFSGTSLICEAAQSRSWTLIGLSNWRIACSITAIDRPRLYDQISSSVDWIQNTVHNH